MSELDDGPASIDASGPHEIFPQAFGRYLLLKQLGRGGMGAVYLAKHGGEAALQKHCVVKTIRRDITAEDALVQRFLDEARVVVQVSHKNIAAVFDVGKVGTRYFLAMEHVQGGDLMQLGTRTAEHGEVIPMNVSLHVVGEVLEALDYAHRLKDVSTGQPLGVVHRDVSPQNIMVSFEGEVKLIDFGLAVSAEKSSNTQENIVLGKLRYMAPEHARGDPVDGRADMFSVAVMTYELAVNEEFYPGLTNQQVWSTAGVGGYRPPRFHEVPPALRAILDKALDADRDKRFATCGEFREALDAYAFQAGLRGGAKALRDMMQVRFADAIQEIERTLGSFASMSAPAPPQHHETPATTVRAPAARGAKRSSVWMGVGGALLVGAVVGIAIAAATKPPPPPPVVVAAPPPPVEAPPPPAVVAAPPPPVVAPPPAPPEPARAEKRPRPPPAGATMGDKLAWLQRVCPRASCTARAKAAKDGLPQNPSRERILDVQRTLNSCVRACAK